MNIYIYGTNDFREEMHSVLDQANINLKIDDYGLIVDIHTLEELKTTIENFPDYIYLIDESRIIKNNYLKFLKNKDSIEHKFLIEHGIEDIHIEDLSDIPKHINERIAIIEANKSFNNSSEDIQEAIIEIVEDAYEDVNVLDNLKENNYFGDNLNDLNTQTINTKHDNFGEQEKIENIKEIENVIKEIDDKDSDINSFMNAFDEENNKESEEFLKSDVNVFLEELDKSIEDVNEEDFSDIMNNFDEEISEDNPMNNFDTIDNENTKNTDENNDFMEGARMGSDYTSLDEINENDMLNALGSDDSETLSTTSDLPIEKEETSSEVIKLDASNVSDISDLISKLLNNKTLEITIKVKN
ncbi:MAG: hypothetical protein HRT40_03240 [Campylobacteraceae bacterium]|nr:hypothetical protein [Campylobacteraceae bacterium]